MTEIKIRKARVKDVPKIVEMWKEFVKDLDGITEGTSQNVKSFWKRRDDASLLFSKYAKSCIMSNNANIFVAEADGNILGHCLCTIKKNIPIFTVEKLGNIGDIFVRRPYRKLGISTLLKNEAMRWFKEKGVKHSSLMVVPTNKKARKIYRNWGFEDFHLEMRMKI